MGSAHRRILISVKYVDTISEMSHTVHRFGDRYSGEITNSNKELRTTVGVRYCLTLPEVSPETICRLNATKITSRGIAAIDDAAIIGPHFVV